MNRKINSESLNKPLNRVAASQTGVKKKKMELTKIEYLGRLYKDTPCIRKAMLKRKV